MLMRSRMFGHVLLFAIIALMAALLVQYHYTQPHVVNPCIVDYEIDGQHLCVLDESPR